ncbi:CHAD domain-containing protein [Tersicoccus sp. MR15.9]|uniref:CHAD domain-containing protein n=1 Tax=Tersicoccus mangrovi TaxID=3121635 RepID=UPI002FE5F15E
MAAAALGDVLAAVVDEQVAALAAHEQGAREDAPDAVHQYRVTLRRLRSVLGAFSAELEPAAAAAGLDLPTLTGRLRDAARAFGLARDAEVNAELVAEALGRGALPAADDADEAGRLLTEAAVAAYQDHRISAIALLDGYGPETLGAVLAAVAAAAREAAGGAEGDAAGEAAREPTRALAGDADAAFAGTIDEQAARVLTLARKAKRAAPGDAVTALHEVRKKAKRLRYTIEELTAHDVAVPPGRQDVVDAAHRIQKHLGTHHDSVGVADFIRSTLHDRPATGRRAVTTAVAFAAGTLAGAEAAVQEAALRKYRKARRALRDALT